MKSLRNRETLISLRATHTAHRVATDIANPHLAVEQPQRVLPRYDPLDPAPALHPKRGPHVSLLDNHWQALIFAVLAFLTLILIANVGIGE